MTADADLWLIGTGIDFDRHVTPEARSVLGSCRRVFHLTAFHERLAEYAADLVDWRETYLSARDSAVYDDMAARLLDETEAGGPIGFACYGHPLVFVDTSVRVIEQAPRRGLSVGVVSGISSIDVLCEALLLDPGLAGLQIFDPNQLINLQLHPDPRVATLIMQVSSVGSSALNDAPECPPERLALLRDHLLHNYRPEHPAVYVVYPFLESVPAVRVETTVGRLDTPGAPVYTGMSLYLPPGRYAGAESSR